MYLARIQVIKESEKPASSRKIVMIFDFVIT